MYKLHAPNPLLMLCWIQRNIGDRVVSVRIVDRQWASMGYIILWDAMGKNYQCPKLDCVQLRMHEIIQVKGN